MTITTIAIALIYTGAGSLLARRMPSNPVGWIVIVIGLFQALNAFPSAYAELALGRTGDPLPLGEIAVWLSSWTWIPSVGLLVTFMLLLFPDGHLPSPRWRVVGWMAALGIGSFLVGMAVATWPLRHVMYANPDAPMTGRFVLLVGVGGVATGIAAVASVVSLIVRFRRSTGDERQQLRWFIVAGALVVAGTIAAVTSLDPSYVVLRIGFVLLPITAAVAILKYRLYDIDVVIRKTAVYAVLAVFITAVYVAIVVGVGALVGSSGNTALSAAAAAVVALAFQPLRRRAQHVADRLVYGRRATPYEVLSDFSERLAGSYANEDLLPRMVTILAEGTGAARADVWLRAGSELRPAATWPRDQSPLEPVRVDAMPERLVAVRHQGELLGALSVEKKPGEPITPTETKLISDLAGQAGLVLRNVGLTQELLARLEELRASRQRLVVAQDEERRKIERDLHDGAQQQLVALAVKLRLTEQLAARDPSKVEAMLSSMQGDAQDALENLRDLARGIYPPLLADKGLAAALSSQAGKAALPTTVEAVGIGRYSQEAESAVYFCALEALNNVAKYAKASRVEIRLAQQNGALTFSIADNGEGFDPDTRAYGTGMQGMHDRLDAAGGALSVESAPGRGTTVTGTVPVA
jgi:signal transduction histidine kinase